MENKKFPAKRKVDEKKLSISEEVLIKQIWFKTLYFL